MKTLPTSIFPFKTGDGGDPVVYAGFRAVVDGTSIKAARSVPSRARGRVHWSPNAGAHKFISMTTNAQCDGDGKNVGPLVVRGPRPLHDGCRTLGHSD